MMQAHDFPFISHSPRRWAEFVRTRTPILESIVPLQQSGARNWKALGNEALLAHAKWMLVDESIRCRKELERVDKRLYQALLKRELLDDVGLEYLRREKRDWAAMERDELVEFARGFIAAEGIGGRTELARADPGLYNALGNRGLLDAIGLESVNATDRDWTKMSNSELIAFAMGFIAERGIGRRTELGKADYGLHKVLEKRKLLDELGLPNLTNEAWNRARFARMEMAALAKSFISESGVRGGRELRRASPGLHRALVGRRLLNVVFSDIESSGHTEAVDDVLDALDSFGDSK